MSSWSTPKRFWENFYRLTVSLTMMLSITGCSPGYVLRAAYEQGKILAQRQKIEKVIARQDTSEEVRRKLELVLSARLFASQIGLDPGNSFKKFSHVDRDILAWVVLGSKPDSFTLYTWWFPIVGSVPYKGFFEKEDAQAAANRLESKGYETWVRGTEAFSTLGWFDDPILSTTLRHDEVTIVDTVIHESVHSTVWIKGHVDFNESLANFIGGEGARQYFQTLTTTPTQSSYPSSTLQALLHQSIEAQARDRELATTIDRLYSELSSLYSSIHPYEEKIRQRTEIFNRIISPIRTKYPTMKILVAPNNAEIMQLKLYLTSYDSFEKLYKLCDAEIPRFMSKIKELSDSLSSKDNPFQKLDQMITQESAADSQCSQR